MKSRSDTVRKKRRVEILEDRKKTGCQDVLKISFVLTEKNDADIGTLDYAVYCKGNVAHWWSYPIGMLHLYHVTIMDQSEQSTLDLVQPFVEVTARYE